MRKINIKVILISNIPAPYREKVYENVSLSTNIEFKVIYCSKLEPNRKWTFTLGNYDKSFISSKYLQINNSHIHCSTVIWEQLNTFNPHVVITCGFGPTMLQAFIWSKFNKRAHIPFTDGTCFSESRLSYLHKIVRKFIYTRSTAFIGASKKSVELYLNYGLKQHTIFQSCLSVENDRFWSPPFGRRPFDLMYSGQFIDRKMPFFFADVARLIVKKRGHCKALILGSGPLQEAFLAALETSGVDVNFKGFIQPSDLPAYYAASKLFLFPTKYDPWGVVANEASASGTPVLTCCNAGAADELIQHGKNGMILNLDSKVWADAAVSLLEDRDTWSKMSAAGQEIVNQFSYDKASSGIVAAVRYAFSCI